MNDELEKLLREISDLQRKLYVLAETRPLTDSEVMALNEEIDKLVITYHRLAQIKEPEN